MALADRITEAMEGAGISQSELACATKKTRSAVNQWLSGRIKTLKAETAAMIEAATGYRASWLVTGVGAKKINELNTALLSNGKPVQTWHQEAPAPLGMVLISQYKIKFSAGNGRTANFEEMVESSPRAYKEDWLKRQGMKPENVRRFKVDGDSMEPFLYSGDTVLVNLAEVNVQNGKVYALRYGEDLRIKRLYKRLNGGLILHSDNPDHRPRDEELSADEVNEHIGIIGRVRDKSGSGGL